MVSAFFSAFVGVIPEEQLDFEWTPRISADNWHAWFKEHPEPSELFLVTEQDSRVIGMVQAEDYCHYPGFDCMVRALYLLPSRQRSTLRVCCRQRWGRNRGRLANR